MKLLSISREFWCIDNDKQAYTHWQTAAVQSVTHRLHYFAVIFVHDALMSIVYCNFISLPLWLLYYILYGKVEDWCFWRYVHREHWFPVNSMHHRFSLVVVHVLQTISSASHLISCWFTVLWHNSIFRLCEYVCVCVCRREREREILLRLLHSVVLAFVEEKNFHLRMHRTTRKNTLPTTTTKTTKMQRANNGDDNNSVQHRKREQFNL